MPRTSKTSKSTTRRQSDSAHGATAVLDAPADAPEMPETPETPAVAADPMSVLMPAERERRARQRLDEVRQQIAAIDTREQETQAALTALAERERAAEQRVEALRAELASMPQKIAAARASLLVAEGTAAESGARGQLVATQQREVELREALDAATRALADEHSEAAAERARLGEQQSQDVAWRGQLVSLIEHLEREIRVAHAAAGHAVLMALGAEIASAEERVREAEERLTTARAELRNLRGQVAPRLAPYLAAVPELTADVHRLAPPVPSRDVRALDAYIAYLATLEGIAGGSGSLMTFDGRQHLGALFTSITPLVMIENLTNRPDYFAQVRSHVEYLRRMAAERS